MADEWEPFKGSDFAPDERKTAFGREYAWREHWCSKGEWEWHPLCQVDGCEENQAWVRGDLMVCDKHRYGDNFVLYRHYDSGMSLLYVGVTNDPGVRLRGHRKSEFWGRLTDGGHTSYERFNSREELLAAEREAIVIEEPEFNIIHAAYRQ